MTLPEAIIAAQLEWTGIQKLKIDLLRHVRNTNMTLRASAVLDGPASVAAATAEHTPPRFARSERKAAAAPRPLSPSLSPCRHPYPTEVCCNCQGVGHFPAACPEPRRERRRGHSPARVNCVGDDRGNQPDQAEEN